MCPYTCDLPTLGRGEIIYAINKEFYKFRTTGYLTTDLILAYPVNDCKNANNSFDVIPHVMYQFYS